MPTRRATLVGMYLLGRAYCAAMYGTPSARAAGWRNVPEANAVTGWTPIAGATGQHYTPRIGDKRHRLRCKVIAHNSAGSAAMDTPQTNAVKGT